MTNYLIITGGVVSSLGKGLTAASLGRLLEARGLTIRLLKFDPYINVDAGTMNPFQHGEVYVTTDGGETDLDLGHYERFTSAPLTKMSNVTTGGIYQAVISRERRGAYEGGCVQVVPHVTNEIKRRIRAITANDDDADAVDVVIVEIGGTVGDIESMPYIEAVRQFALDVGRDHVAFVHLVLLPYLKASDELKTKPAQHSNNKLRESGIQPDLLIVRCERPITPEIRAKLSLFCNVRKKAVIEERDVDHSIYEVPVILHEQGADDLIVSHFGLQTPPPELADWRAMLNTLIHPTRTVTIGVAGKYLDLPDAYKSIFESLTHAGIPHDARVTIARIDSEALTDEATTEAALCELDGILVPGGFGERGIEGKIRAAHYARTQGVPYFGICLGLQCLVIEFAREVLRREAAQSTEFAPDGPDPIIHIMPEQRGVAQRGGTMRLGQYPCDLLQGSRAQAAYGALQVNERHRHRYEFNPAYRLACESAGMRFSGVNPESGLIEIAELPEHPWMVGVQFHPEFQSAPTAPHPLFRAFVGAALTHRAARSSVQSAPNASAPAPLVDDSRDGAPDDAELRATVWEPARPPA